MRSAKSRGPGSLTSGSKESPRTVIAMLAIVAIPAAITLNTVRSPVILTPTSANPTPHGYTWSLLLFLFPVVAIACWLLPSEGIQIPRRAFWWTIGILAPLGCATDFFFASRFFTFSNPGATLGVLAPALHAPVPVEEYVFYVSGFLAVLLLYLWLDEFWLAAYNIPDYRLYAKGMPRLVRFHGASLAVGVLLITAGILYKRLFSADSGGFPGYFTFLVAVGIVPSMGFFPAARPFINWRALSLTGFMILLVSMLWEATLALPYGWWGFQSRQMLGLHIGAWAGLPIEEVGLWIAVTYTTVIIFETVKLWLASERPARQAFLGQAAPAGAGRKQ